MEESWCEGYWTRYEGERSWCDGDRSFSVRVKGADYACQIHLGLYPTVLSSLVVTP